MKIPETLQYSEEHEWVGVADGIATVGITDYAQDELGDIVFVELPVVGTVVSKAKPLGVVESVKAVSDVYAPLSGAVVEVNASLASNPERINEDPYGEGWMVRIRVADGAELSGLMTAAQYGEFVAKEKA